MAFSWLASIKEISEIVASLGSLVTKNRAMKDLLIRELHINIKAFETVQKSAVADYDKLLGLLQNSQILKALESRFSFYTIKSEVIKEHHVFDDRNKRYIGKSCGWMFKNIDEKIEDLRNQQKYHGSLNKIADSNMALQFSNLFFKMKLLADFIRS
ncbi:MAG TPA: hypothetical protein PKW80_12425 [Bacteroidales bacterium]|nr:hypothetical protein [Bacteroidales bacterium]